VSQPRDPAASRTTVLLVDDQVIVEKALRSLLGPYPEVELLAVQDAEAGFELALQRRPDVILQDLVMPGVDGMQQIQRIRASEVLAETPLVVLSANEDAATKERCFALGANDYLVKLPEALELVARIRYHARMGRAQRERDRAMRALAQSQAELVRRNAEVDSANRRLSAMNELLGQESQDQRERIAEVAALGTKLGRAQDLAEVMDQTLRLARSFTDADAGSIWMTEANGLRLVYSQNDTLESRLAPGERLPLADVCVPLDASSIAGYVATKGRPLRIEDVHALDPSLPYHFKADIDRKTGYHTRSMLVFPLHDARDEVVGVLQLINARGRGKQPRETAVFTQADEAAVELFAGMASLALERAKLVRGVIMRTIATAEMRDPTETGAHVQRVAECSVAMYDRWAAIHDIDESERVRRRDELRIAAMLHDVGKVAIPDAILKKPGKLDDAEYQRMQTHAVLGGRLFAEAATPYDEAARDVAVHHHEKWDGTGYPGTMEGVSLGDLPPELAANPPSKPLRGDEIPLFARIVAVADVYDALTSQRSYKEPWSREQVSDFLRRESGKHFDPELVGIALELQGYFESVRARFAGNH
jgi:response regulator RpfG family c-di-GMP phosphodiesterase